MTQARPISGALLLSFTVRLQRDDLPVSVWREQHGPIFHRWLPDGKRDAITLPTPDANADLTIWFERFGRVDGEYINFSYEHREVDPELMSQQAVLYGGPLCGMLELRGLSGEELKPIRERDLGNDRYADLAKRVVKLIYPPVTHLINILRTNFGQYWLPKIEKWDSLRETIAHYCYGNFQLEWSLDEGNTWDYFFPGRARQWNPPSSSFSEFREYITQEDWSELAALVQQDYSPSFAAAVLTQAHELADKGDLRYALVEGSTALEIAIDQFLRSHFSNPPILRSTLNWLQQSESFKHKFAVAVAILGNLPDGDITLALNATDMRHKIVHEGWTPSDQNEAKTALQGLLRTVGAFLGGPRFRFPPASPHNFSRSAERWDQHGQKGDRSIASIQTGMEVYPPTLESILEGLPDPKSGNDTDKRRRKPS